MNKNNESSTNVKFSIPLSSLIKKYELPGQYHMMSNIDIPLGDFCSKKDCLINDNHMIFPEEYHFYKDSLHEYKQFRLESNLESAHICTTKDFGKFLCEAYDCDKEHYDNVIKRHIQDVSNDKKLINELFDVIKNCIFNVNTIAEKMFANKRILNDRDKLPMHFFVEINKLSNDRFYNDNCLMNIKDTNEQGKHVSEIDIKNKHTVSSTVLKKQIRDNKIIEDVVYDKLSKHISTEENEIVQCIRTMKKNDDTFYKLKQNKYLQIILNNYTLFCIQERLVEYNKFLDIVEHNFKINPQISTCPDIIYVTQILQNKDGNKLIYKLNETELKSLDWNLNKGNIIFDQIYLVNMYDYQKYMYLKPKSSNDIFSCFGYAIAHSREKKRWNVFPSDDERMNYNNTQLEKYNKEIHNYVTL